MFEKSTITRFPKLEITVDVTLVGKPTFTATLFLKKDERLIDMLNDEHGFIPLRNEAGDAVMIAKSSIESLVERSEEHAGVHGEQASDENQRAQNPFGSQNNASSGETSEETPGEKTGKLMQKMAKTMMHQIMGKLAGKPIRKTAGRMVKKRHLTKKQTM